MCSLYEDGITVSVGLSLINVKLGIFLGVADLQVKVYILNMTICIMERVVVAYVKNLR